MDERDLAEELMAMLAEQEDLVQRTGTGAVGPVPPEIEREQREVFVRHADRLKELIGEYGWPTSARVGEQAARGAWLIAQHADTQLDVQRLAVQLLGQAVAPSGPATIPSTSTSAALTSASSRSPSTPPATSEPLDPARWSNRER